MAPAVVFYTAGYRWNAKKGAIERNGTLIIDTLPVGATIKLNDKPLTDKSPITMQNVSPGNYNIQIQLDGYHPWSKTLAIEPERVTFATDIMLWPISEPQKVSDEPVCFIASKPEGTALLVGICDAQLVDSFAMFDPQTDSLTGRTKLSEPLAPNDIYWSTDERSVLIRGVASGTAQTWLYRSSPAALSRLPEGTSHWDGTSVLAVTADQNLTIKADGSVSRSPKDTNTIDSLGAYSIQLIPASQDLALVMNSRKDEGNQLPRGDWRIREIVKKSVLLQDGMRWLWLDTSQRPFNAQSAVGQWPTDITLDRNVHQLLMNGNEVWTWTQGLEPNLIYRQSDPLRAAAWQPNGNDVMIATDKELFILNLDARGGRLRTELASFDEILDATVIGDTAYIAGTKNGSAGLWRIMLIKPTVGLPSLGIF